LDKNWKSACDDLVCDFTCVIIRVIFRVVYLIVVTTAEYPINRLTNPNPVYKSLKHMAVI
jgi:hypothetical protein